MQKAIKALDSTTKSIQTELRSVEKLLKFDPTNTILLAQKQSLLAEQIKNSTDKLNALKQAEIQIKAEFEKGNVSKEQYRDFERQLSATKQTLEKTTIELEEMNTEVIKLDGSVDGANTELVKTDDNLEQINKNTAFTALVTKAQLALGAIKALATGMFNLVMSAVDTTSQIEKLSNQTGTTTEEYQKLDAVFKASGFSMEQAAGDFSALNERILDAKTGTGEAAEMFEKLGVKVTNAKGELKSTSTVFNETIMALQNMKNETDRSATASILLGTTGEELASVLKMTNKEFLEMKENVSVISEEDIEKANEFKKEWGLLSDEASKAKTQLSIELMPAIKDIMDTIKENMPEIKAVLSDVFEIVAALINFILDYGKPLAAIMTIILGVWLGFKFAAMIEFMQAGITGMKGMITTIATLGTTIDPVYLKVAKWVLLISAVVVVVMLLVKALKDLIKAQNESKALDMASVTGNYSALKAVNGSHANGLANVPFSGYIAELHEGERVLTKQENQSYGGSGGNNDSLLSELISEVRGFKTQLYNTNRQNQAVAGMR